MSSRQASSLEVEIVNGTRSSTLRFFHRTGLLSSQRKELTTLTPPSGDQMTVASFVFRFKKGTNELIDVEYKVEMENQVEVENENHSNIMHQRHHGVSRGTYKPVGVRIDSTLLREHSKIIVVDSEAAQSSAGASSRKKFELRTEPRAVRNEAGWLVTLVMMLYAFSSLGLKYVISGLNYGFSGFRNLISATQPPAPISESPDPISESPAPISESPAAALEP